jgi:hypothetical protein
LAQPANRLQAQGHWNLMPLISHVRPYQEVGQLFDTPDRNPQSAMQAVLDFRSQA